MGIDRIGSGGAAPPEGLSPGGATGPSAKTEKSFEVSREPTGAPAPAAAGATAEVKPSAALEGVRSGALDVKGYVDAKVAEATAHLSHLSPSQLQIVQGVVRDQLLSDPHLRDLVEHATGSPPPKDEE